MCRGMLVNIYVHAWGLVGDCCVRECVLWVNYTCISMFKYIYACMYICIICVHVVVYVYELVHVLCTLECMLKCVFDYVQVCMSML